ncbi:hypothetical protein D3C76_1619440 [compost metagenome]
MTNGLHHGHCRFMRKLLGATLVYGSQTVSGVGPRSSRMIPWSWCINALRDSSPFGAMAYLPFKPRHSAKYMNSSASW